MNLFVLTCDLSRRRTGSNNFAFPVLITHHSPTCSSNDFPKLRLPLRIFTSPFLLALSLILTRLTLGRAVRAAYFDLISV